MNRQLQKSFVARFWGVCLVMAMLSGCGGVYDASVTGTVTLDGQPVTRGTVSYFVVGQGPTAYGLIEADGTYSLKVGREEGLPAGEYKVSVTANEASTPNENPSLPPSPGKSITPPWYRSASTSNLKQTVNAGANELNLELTTEPPADWKPPKRRRRR